MKPVQQTEFADYFPAKSNVQAWLLDTEESQIAFQEKFGGKGNCYFQFPDDHWVVKSIHKTVGDWRIFYNTEDESKISNLLKATIEWNLDDHVLYLVKKSFVFQLKWRDFLMHWSAFLMIEDDATFVTRITPEKVAIMFTAFGEIRLIAAE